MRSAIGLLSDSYDRVLHGSEMSEQNCLAARLRAATQLSLNTLSSSLNHDGHRDVMQKFTQKFTPFTLCACLSLLALKLHFFTECNK